ncbi:MAG TPA: MFS transporter [Polyangiales bacterium]|jgi:fucose permease|nr:MFS transporter [Polyangiales bacterium]
MLRASALLLVLSYAGFVSLGLPDTVLGAAWPAMRVELALPMDAAGGILLVTTTGVVVSGTATGWLRARIGAGSVLWGSTALAALALIMNGLAPHWSLLLVAAACAGLGGGAIDATLNDHVARHHSARHMNWLHACWGVGAAIAPNVVALVLERGLSWRTAYFTLGAVEALLTLSFVATRGHWREQVVAAESGGDQPPKAASARSAMNASIALFFCYGGLEAGAGLWASSLLVGTRGLSVASAGAAVGLYWGALCVGRFVIGAYADRIGPARVLRSSVLAALLAVIAFALPGTPTAFAIGALAALGFALAPIYPLTMHDTPRRFPEPAGARLVGLQVAATALGVASMPWLMGAIAARTALVYLPAQLTLLAIAVVVLEQLRRRAS